MATAYHTATDELAILAQALIDGGSHPFGTHGYYTFEEWRTAAEYWQDTRDTDELAEMFDREEKWDRYCGLRHRDQIDFDDWLDGRTDPEPSIGGQWPGNAVMGLR